MAYSPVISQKKYRCFLNLAGLLESIQQGLALPAGTLPLRTIQQLAQEVASLERSLDRLECILEFWLTKPRKAPWCSTGRPLDAPAEIVKVLAGTRRRPSCLKFSPELRIFYGQLPEVIAHLLLVRKSPDQTVWQPVLGKRTLKLIRAEAVLAGSYEADLQQLLTLAQQGSKDVYAYLALLHTQPEQYQPPSYGLPKRFQPKAS